MLTIEALRAVAIFRDVPPEMVDAITRVAAERVCREGEYVFPRRSDLGLVSAKGRALFVKEGSLRIVAHEQGKTVTLVTMNAGSFFADLAEKPFPGFFVSDSPTKLCVISQKDFEAFLARYPKIALRVLRLTAGQLRETEEKLAHALAQDAASRILRELSREGATQQPDGSFRLPYVTHEKIAQRVGLARETVTRTIARLMGSGKLERLPQRMGYILRNKLQSYGRQTTS